MYFVSKTVRQISSIYSAKKNYTYQHQSFFCQKLETYNMQFTSGTTGKSFSRQQIVEQITNVRRKKTTAFCHESSPIIIIKIHVC